MAKYDFSGWATKSNIKCSDGRIITSDAFKHMDGMEVPLVWNHQHNDLNNVLGKALLEHRDGKGIYAYCTLNDSDSGQAARAVLEHGDVTHLSIWANNLKQHMNSVLHGNIREVSLVLAGANPGAVIENVAIVHGEEMHEYENEACIYTDEAFELYHADADDEEDEEDVEDAEDSDSDVEDKDAEDKKKKKGEEEVAEEVKKDANTKVEPEVKEAKEEEIKHADKADDSEETVADVFNTLSEKQKTVVYAMIGQALEDAGKENDEESEGGNDDMKHNVFDQDERQETQVLSHSEMTAIFEDAKRGGSLRDAFLAHGIEDIDILFPDAKNVTATPEFIKRDDNWVTEVLNGVHHTPFSRIKTIFADITADEARAKGYVKGNLKVEEVIKLLKRITNPTTIYKKQKLDRDDVIDITDMDVVAWLKQEMRVMLNEEIARAILIGDGRSADSQDKINEENIRPIWTDEDLYTVKATVSVDAAASAEDKAKAFIKACVKSRKNYKGSGNPVMYMSEDILTDCLLIEDMNGRRIYESIDKLAGALTVKKIVPVTVMDNVTRTVGDKSHRLAGLYVNLNDYNVGADKGGAINMFDDFDIDYNAQKYLMETRCSGALTKPYAAVAIEFVTESAAG